MKKLVYPFTLIALICVILLCLTISGGAVAVSDANGFAEAVAEGGEVTLLNDITLEEGILIHKAVSIDGNGHTLAFSKITRFSSASEYVYLNSSVAAAGYAIQVSGGTVSFTDITLMAPTSMTKGGALLLLSGEAELSLHNVVTDGGYFSLLYHAAAELTVSGEQTHIGKNAGSAYVVAATDGANGAVLNLANGRMCHTAEGEETKDGSYGLYLKCSSFTLNVSGGAIAANNAVYVANGALTLQISGGTLSANEDVVSWEVGGSLALTMTEGCVTSANGSAFSVPVCTENVFDISGGLIASEAENTCALRVSGVATISGTARLKGSLILAGGTTSIGGSAVLTRPTYFYEFSQVNRRLALIHQSADAALFVTGGKLDIGDANGYVILMEENADTQMSGGRLVVGATGEVAKLLGGTLDLRNVLIVDGGQVTDTVFSDGGIVLRDCIVITRIAKSVGADQTATLTAASPTVKYSGTPYYLWMSRAGEANAPTLGAGAGVRAELGSQGIRFTASLDRITADALARMGEVTYGILIAPADFVAAAGSFTLEGLVAYAAKKGVAPETVYANVVAKNSLSFNDDAVCFNAALIEIKTGNYSRKFAAVAYAAVNGEYYYSAYDSAENARSISDVAAAALADAKTAEDLLGNSTWQALYIHQVEDTAYYSKYTKAQRDALSAYVAA